MNKDLFDGQRNSADIIIIDGLPPEEGAMSQSLYSRKPKSVLYHLIQVMKKGAQSFMEIFYSKYGHNSIGDCGSTTLYLENVSMLAAKAFQDWPLYNGQEASTRYLDFTGRTMINPLAGLMQTTYLHISREMLTKSLEDIGAEFNVVEKESIDIEAGALGQMIQNRWMTFYEKNMPIVKAHIASLNPKKPEQDQVAYEKAINARAFDIMRGFIPAGMTTLVSWHSNLRQLRDHLNILKYHPSSEISTLAQTAIAGLKATYPASFVKDKEYPETEAYLKKVAEIVSYWDSYQIDGTYIDATNMDMISLKEYEPLLNCRPPKTEIPHVIGEVGTINVAFNIDFGSFRDAQRHRKGVCLMPILTTKLGFHPWYLERLPEDIRAEAETLIEELKQVINDLPCDDVDRQYYIPMGYMVEANFTWSFDQLVYVAELRSSETVHPTFRVHAQNIGRWIEEYCPYVKLHIDYSDDVWSFKRGTQDIIEKK